MATWTPPRTWVDGETPNGAMFNVHIRDNLTFLKETPSFDGVLTTEDVLVTNDATINNDLHVLGNTTLDGNATIGDAPADVVQINGTVKGAPLQTYTETRTTPAIAGGTLTLDCSLGTYYRVSLNSNCTVTILNAPADGRALGITIIFVADGTARAITWPGTVVWPAGIGPTMTSVNGKRDIVTLLTEDGGATWFGVIVGQSY